MQFVAAGFDLAQFWRLTPRSFVLMMHGARDGVRARSLSMAAAVRAGSKLDNDDFEKWVDAVSGEDRRLPPEVLHSELRRAAQGMETIDWGEALRRMH